MEESKSNKKLINSMVLVGGFVVLGVWWSILGFPGIGVMFDSSQIETSCKHFAEEKIESNMFMDFDKIETGETWIKDGRRVVEIRLMDGDSGFRTRYCVYGKGSIQIPAIINQSKWE